MKRFACLLSPVQSAIVAVGGVFRIGDESCRHRIGRPVSKRVKLSLLLLGAFAAWGAGAVDWDSIPIRGTTSGGDQTFTVDGGYDRAVENQRTSLNAVDPVACRTVRLKGPLGATLDRMVERHVGGTDVDYITACFQEKTERKFWWQTEFWGKYMHAAVPFAEYSGSPKIRADIERGIDRILAS